MTSDIIYALMAMIAIAFAMFGWYVAWWLEKPPICINDLAKRSFWLVGLAALLIAGIFLTFGHRVGVI